MDMIFSTILIPKYVSIDTQLHHHRSFSSLFQTASFTGSQMSLSSMSYNNNGEQHKKVCKHVIVYREKTLEIVEISKCVEDVCMCE